MAPFFGRKTATIFFGFFLARKHLLLCSLEASHSAQRHCWGAHWKRLTLLENIVEGLIGSLSLCSKTCWEAHWKRLTLLENNCCCSHWKRLSEMLPMSTSTYVFEQKFKKKLAMCVCVIWAYLGLCLRFCLSAIFIPINVHLKATNHSSFCFFPLNHCRIPREEFPLIVISTNCIVSHYCIKFLPHGFNSHVLTRQFTCC